MGWLFGPPRSFARAHAQKRKLLYVVHTMGPVNDVDEDDADDGAEHEPIEDEVILSLIG